MAKSETKKPAKTTPEHWANMPDGFPKGVETLDEIIAFIKGKFNQKTIRGAIGVVREDYKNTLENKVSEISEDVTPEMTKLAKYIEMIYNKFGTTSKQMWELLDDGTTQWTTKKLQNGL